MKRNKILAAAIVATLTSPLQAIADTANVNVYGKFDLSYDLVNTGTATNGTAGTTVGRVSSNTSRIGLKGSEDIGDGLSAIWQVESQLYVGDATVATLGTRNTYAGFKGDSFGTVLAGRHDTPYRLSTRRLDVFPDGVADNRSIFGGVAGTSAATAFDGRQNQVVVYISPKIGGLTGAIGYVNLNPSLTVGTVGAASTTSKQTALSLAGWYDANGFYGSAAYEVHNLAVTAGTAGTAAAASATAVTVSEKATRMGFGYTQDLFNVNAAYEKTSDDYGVANANKYGHSAIYVSGKFNLSDSNAIKAALTKQGNVGGVANTGVSQYSLGFDHNFSKRTTVYALYSKIRNGSAASYGLSSNGTAGASSIVGAGASPSVIAAGVSHTF
jgi:predicted porin